MRGGARPRAGRKPKGSDPAAAGDRREGDILIPWSAVITDEKIRKMMEDLQLERNRLLAENKRLRLEVAGRASEAAVKKVYGKQEVATYTPHGEFCACLGCRGRG